MPTKKKSQVNRTGLYYFAVEYRQLHSNYVHKSIHDIILVLLPRWRSMSLIEKKPYEDLAKQYKRMRMLDHEHVDTPVIPSSVEALFIEKNIQENHFLNDYLSKDLREIYHRHFFFVTFQIFCRTDDEDGGDYYPAEFAIMKYSFAESMIEEYFTIMKPEKFPVGYTGTVIDLSRQTHQIPPFNFIGANGDYSRIYSELQRILGDLTDEPKIIFCHAFEREQTTYLLNWLASKRETTTKIQPKFQIYSFEALVVAVLRRLGIGDYAHQSVREQLHRPVYTLQIKERCVYHHSLAIQYCARAINNGFRLFLDDFIRQRFIDKIPEEKILKKTSLPITTDSISEPSMISCVDSMNSMMINDEQRTNSVNDPNRIHFSSKSIIPTRILSPIQVDCRWSTSSHQTTSSNDEHRYVMTGRGIRPLIKNNPSDSLVFVNNIGRGRPPNFLSSSQGFTVSLR